MQLEESETGPVGTRHAPWRANSDIAGLCLQIEMVVAAAFNVPLDEIQAPTRRAQSVAFARQSAIYLAHVVFGLPYVMLGKLFRRDRTTAAYACRLIEEYRDDPPIDALFQRLEGVCAEIAGSLKAGEVRQ